METRSPQTRLDQHEEQLQKLQSDVMEIKNFIQSWESARAEERDFRKGVMSWVNQQGKKPNSDSGGPSVISSGSHRPSTPPDGAILMKGGSNSGSQFHPLHSFQLDVFQIQNPCDQIASIKQEGGSGSPLRSDIKAQSVGLFEIKSPIGSGLNDKGPPARLEPNRSYYANQSPLTPTSSSSAVPSQSQGFRSLSRTEWEEQRKKGLCFRCGQTFGPTHKCPEGKLRVLLLADDEAIDDGGEIIFLDVNDAIGDRDDGSHPVGFCTMLEFHGDCRNPPLLYHRRHCHRQIDVVRQPPPLSETPLSETHASERRSQIVVVRTQPSSEPTSSDLLLPHTAAGPLLPPAAAARRRRLPPLNIFVLDRR